MFTEYKVVLTLKRQMLATNPIDPNIHGQHVLNKQRELITENSSVNKEINKYLGALQISVERGDQEVDSLIKNLERLMGREFTPDQRAAAIRGELEQLQETLAEQELKSATVFFRHPDTGRPCIGDHMIKGQLKAAGQAIVRAAKERKNGTVLQSGTYTASILNEHLSVDPHFVEFEGDLKLNEDGSLPFLSRSIRIQTPQGPRVAVVKSEVIPAGTKLSFTINVLENSPLTEDVLRKLFTYGEKMLGLGQWRNAGFGQFSYELTKVSK